ncbi:MAG: DUF167 family protein [Methanoregulaceae archaeon]|jgi:hypothetical protein|nr:DUF167 family protein [Methanoregulaceae archaeon]MCU0628239.1 DUF167 family protein [Methanoregulaceae archaeon]
MTDIMPALTSSDKGTIITIEVTAGSKKASFPAGYNEWRKALGCMVRAPALEGRANKEVIAVISERIGIEKTRISIISGRTAPIKKILVEGMTPDQIRSALSVA